METDVRGYYATLGVSLSAPASEIKSAYRRLAKLHHPDSNSSQGDAEIKQLNEAYAILGNPSRRAAYDSAGISTESSEAAQQEQIDPLRCSRCNKITAQARYLIFWRVYSVILATIRTPVQGIFCASCAKSEALRSTAITAIFGWWGVPWGPVWTVINGLQDSLGGEQDKARNEALGWYSVTAFIQARQIPIAYGLAKKLLSAEDEGIRIAATEFTSLCRAHGFESKGDLKDSWSAVRLQAPLRIGILGLLPALVAGSVYLSSSEGSASTFQYVPEEPFDYSGSGIDDSALESATPPLQNEEMDIGPLCASAPANGEILAGGENLAAEGHRLEIDNGSSGDAIVKVRRASNNQLYASFFVQEGESGSLSGVGDGAYSIQYAIGDKLGEDCSSFAGDARIAEFPGVETFQSEYINDYRGEGFMYQSLSYTLYTVPGGNIRPTTISASEFNSN